MHDDFDPVNEVWLKENDPRWFAFWMILCCSIACVVLLFVMTIALNIFDRLMLIVFSYSVPVQVSEVPSAIGKLIEVFKHR